jgi:flagellar biosynthesis GTPase FlhF
VKPFRGIEERKSVDGEQPTEPQQPAAVGGEGGGSREPPTEVHALGGDGPKHSGRKIGAPLVILAVVAFLAWGIPITQGFHFGCNLFAGDKFREVRLGLEMCRGENSTERSRKATEAREKTEAEQREQQAREQTAANQQREEREKEEAERPHKEAEERAEKAKQKHEQEQTEHEVKKTQEQTEREAKKSQDEAESQNREDERINREDTRKSEEETKRSEQEANSQ